MELLLAAIRVDSYDVVLKLLGHQPNPLCGFSSSSSDSDSDSDSDVVLLTMLPKSESLRDLLPITTPTCPKWLLSSTEPLHLAVGGYNYNVASLLLELYEENMEPKPFQSMVLAEVDHAIEAGFSRFLILALPKVDTVPMELFRKSAQRGSCVVLGSPSFHQLSQDDIKELAMIAIDHDSVRFLETLLKLEPLDDWLLFYAAQQGKSKAFDVLIGRYWARRVWDPFGSGMILVWHQVIEKRNYRMMNAILKFFEGHSPIPEVSDLAPHATKMFQVALAEMDTGALQAIGKHLSGDLDRGDVTELLAEVMNPANYLDLQRIILAFDVDMLGPLARAILRKGLHQEDQFNLYACRMASLWTSMQDGNLHTFIKTYTYIRQSSVSRQLPHNSVLFEQYRALLSRIHGCCLDEVEPEIDQMALDWQAKHELKMQTLALLSTYTNCWGYVTGTKNQKGAAKLHKLKRTHSD